MINIDVYSTQAVIRSQEPLTVGLVGGEAHFRFSAPWKPLIKTVVFRQGNVTKDVVGVTSGAVIPWEVLQEPGLPVEIGIYGCDSSGKVMIPTVWAVTDPVLEGADPMLDASAELTPDVHQQLLGLIGEADKATYTAAPVTVDGVVVSNRTVEELTQAYQAKKVLQFHDGVGYVYALEGIGRDGNGAFIYTFRCNDAEGNIRIAKISYPNVLERSSLDMATVADTRAVYRVNVAEENKQYKGNRTMGELKAAYLAGKVPVCWLGGRECCLTGTGKDAYGTSVFYFAGTSSGGGVKQVVRVYAPEGDETAPVLADVTAEISASNLTGYSMLGRVGVIGDSLSVGTVDILNETGGINTLVNPDYSWAAWLSRTCGNPWLMLGFGGASSATWIINRLDNALKEENLCDAYIIGLGYNDNRYYSVPLGSMDDITNAAGKELISGSYYFNIHKILYELSQATREKAPIFVLTNPDFSEDYATGAAAYNQALRNIIAAYGSTYNAHLIDLHFLYQSVYEELESSRGTPGHFNAQAYAYMGQLIGTAISNYMLHNPDSFKELRGYIPPEVTAEQLAQQMQKYDAQLQSHNSHLSNLPVSCTNLFDWQSSGNLAATLIGAAGLEAVESDGNNVYGVTHPIYLEAGVKYKATHATMQGGTYRVARLDGDGNVAEVYATYANGVAVSEYLQIETDGEGLNFEVFTPPASGWYVFNYTPRYASYANKATCMVCRYEDFPTEKDSNGVLTFIPHQPVFEGTVRGENILGNVPGVSELQENMDVLTGKSQAHAKELVKLRQPLHSIFRRVICIGDSLTRGYNAPLKTAEGNANRDFSYPAALMRWAHMDTVNYGLSGSTPVSWWERYQAADLSGYDCAIICLGRNRLEDYGLQTQEELDAYQAIIDKLKARNEHITIFLCTLPPNDNPQALKDSRDIPTNAAIADLAQTNGLPLLNLYDSGYIQDSKWRNSDGIHYTSMGYLMMAVAIVEEMDAYMLAHPEFLDLWTAATMPQQPPLEGLDMRERLDDQRFATKDYVDEAVENAATAGVDLSGHVKAPATAKVGQTIVVKAVDDNCKPTEWEAADMRSGDSSNGYTLLNSLTLSEETRVVEFTSDLSGNPFAFEDLLILLRTIPMEGASEKCQVQFTFFTGTQKVSASLTNAVWTGTTQIGCSSTIIKPYASTMFRMSCIRNGETQPATAFGAYDDSLTADSYVDKIQVFIPTSANHSFGVGTTIEVYGR